MIRHCIAISLFSLGSTANASETITYSYDALGRLVTSSYGGTVNNSAQTTYQFDQADNRTSVTNTGWVARVVVVPINGFTVIPIP